MTAITADPSRALSTVDVLADQERARLDALGHRGALTRAVAQVSIPELFASRVAAAPDAVAVSGGGRSVTYAELDEASNRLAHLLTDHGVGPGRVVALMSARSAEAIAAMLAVLKCGAAYLPIDPGLPAERIEFVVTDAKPLLAITTAEFTDRLAGFDGVIVDVDDIGTQTYPSTTVSVATGGDLAYVIYTSGTTGVPKGVGLTHANVTQLLGSLEAGLPSPGVWSHAHSLAFDVSVWEIFGPLLRGGRVVVMPDEVARSPQDLHALRWWPKASPCLTQTPSAAAVLSPKGLESTALVVVGEACPPEVVDRWSPGRVMVNAYGPTETTMCVAISAPLVTWVGRRADRVRRGWGGVVRAGRVAASGGAGGDR